MKLLKSIILLFLSLWMVQTEAQQIINGRIYAPMTHFSTEGIMVEASSHHTAFTDSIGSFRIEVMPHDTLYFYINSKRSRPFLVDSIRHPSAYAISLQSIIGPNPALTLRPTTGYDSLTGLDNVTVYTRDYRKDSLANRQEYGKYYDYKDPKLGLNLLASPVTAVYDVLNFKKKKQMNLLKNNLHRQEEEGFVDTRFTRSFVEKYTQIKNEDTLNDFMRKYRPPYSEISTMSDLDLITYIHDAYQKYKQNPEAWNMEEGSRKKKK